MEWAFVESAEKLRRRRIDCAGRILAAHEFAELREIGLLEFAGEMLSPAFVDADGFDHGE